MRTHYYDRTIVDTTRLADPSLTYLLAYFLIFLALHIYDLVYTVRTPDEPYTELGYTFNMFTINNVTLHDHRIYAYAKIK